MWKMCIWLNQAGWQRSLEDRIHQSPHRHEREDHCFLTGEITWLGVCSYLKRGERKREHYVN
jgi:hypothetical protein